MDFYLNDFLIETWLELSIHLARGHNFENIDVF